MLQGSSHFLTQVRHMLSIRVSASLLLMGATVASAQQAGSSASDQLISRDSLQRIVAERLREGRTTG